MARPARKNITYAGWNVDMFDNDEKIIRLLAAQGWLGFSIFFFICQRAYGTEGYYYQWSDASTDIIAYKMGGGIRSETVKQTVETCLRLGLFDNRLFAEGVLTGRCIQKRYAEAIQKRSVRTVIKDYWLFDAKDEESKGLTFITPEQSFRSENPSFRGENPRLLPENATNEMKLNEIKEEEEEDARAREEADRDYLDSEWVKFVKLYEQNIGMMPHGGYALEELQDYFENFGYDVMEVAVRAVAKAHAYNPQKYLQAIMRGWIQADVKTVDQAKANIMEHERAMNAQKRSKGSSRGQRESRPQPTGPQLKPGVNPFD